MVTVAGIGCRRGTGPAAVIAAVRAAERAFDVTAECLATAPLKAGEAGLLEAAKSLSLSLEIVSQERLEAVASKTMTFSQASLDHAGSPSVSEAAALAAAGENARLVAPRLVVDDVTVAIATTDDAPQKSSSAIEHGEQ
ncbi:MULTISPECIES: cobalamin biosynthesis protein [Agrobacterium]|nr:MULTISPECIES: cobalamin biosynthesis protein [Agrobacterium]MBA4776948.1 cobalamin biosynthesis protein [Hyphomicrobiales bacterium]MCZ7851944.1 cobalamin biosynthesis protein [Agrobacterium salinitolerans]MCZ7857648.1 cobalamin biosynthesis protein [Agrobacterium salinitolerans]MCZ7864039.1 cobalamin biosynthesis protein [Agrobacterium salinitolerans]MCZ7888254.1 cobalamin biosynthesis protein [Agrobacterium salinitolerans]